MSRNASIVPIRGYPGKFDTIEETAAVESTIGYRRPCGYGSTS
jgi:hypothetical protein